MPNRCGGRFTLSVARHRESRRSNVISTPSCVPAEWFDFRVGEVRGLHALRWAEGKRFRVPGVLAQRLDLPQAIDDAGACVLTAELPRPTVHDAESLRMLRAFTEERPTSSRLPFSYQRIPTWI